MRDSLDAWEAYLRPWMLNIRLLGEIPITPADLVQLEGLLRQEIKIHKIKKTTDRLKTEWQAALVVYLAFKAAYNKEWNFWDNVAADLGVRVSNEFFMEDHHWGKAYLSTLESFGLTTFENLEAGHQYIPRIRMHGGVPAYSLPDFFAHILLPSLQKPDLQILEDQPVLDNLLESSYVRFFVDDPVQQFFKHGGESALRFFSKCRQMARLAISGEELPDAEALGLRPYVVEAFRKHLWRQVEGTTGKTRRRWKAPKIVFFPFQPPSYQVSLPEQVIPLEAANRPYAWRLISPEGEERIHRVRLYRAGQVVLSRNIEETIEEPWQTLRVAFSAEGENVPPDLRREWHFNLLPGPGQMPLRAYRYTDYKPLDLSAALPAETCWLLYPVGAQLHFGGLARCIEEATDYWPPWDIWQAAAYDLSQADWVQVVPGEGTPPPPIPVETRLDEPQLMGKNLLAASIPIDDKQLYIGQPPILCLPRQPGQVVEEALHRWDISLESLQDADPGGRWALKDLAQGAQSSPDDPNIILLPLRTVLGEGPTGSYHVACMGPDQIPYDLAFRICPYLEISGLQPYYLPDPQQGAQPVTFQVSVLPNQQIHTFSDEEGIQIKALGGGLFTITVAGEQSQADLLLETTIPRQQVRIPIRLAVPRLRWTLCLQPGDPMDWQARPFSRPLAEILQSKAPTLHVELPNHCQEEVLLDLKLVDPDTGIELQCFDTQTLHQNQEYIRFDLKGFSDTLHSQRHLSFIEVHLEWLDPSLDRLLSLPLLRLTQALDVRAVWVQTQPDGTWMVHWHEPQPLRHRRLYLWSEWQPWADPLDIQIPDDPDPSDSLPVEGWWMILIPPEEAMPPPGHYRAFFTVVPPWDHSKPHARPPVEALVIATMQPQERLHQIEADLQKHPQRAFALHFERACVYETANDLAKRGEEIQWCLAHWRNTHPIYLLALHNWLGTRDVQTQRAVRMYMYHPESLQNLLATPLPPNILQAYFEPFPQAQAVNPAAALQVLELSRDPAVINHALGVLLKSDSNIPKAVEYILTAMQADRFADQDALDFLKPYARKAIVALTARPLSPVRDKLLARLLQEDPQPDLVVLQGYWVRSDAGWGRIESIRNGPGEEEIYFYSPTQDQPFLEVTLRPTEAPERVTVDLKINQLCFRDTERTYLCTKSNCEHFISANLEHVRGDHNRAAHQGLGPAFRPAASTFILFHQLEYRAKPPTDEFE